MCWKCWFSQELADVCFIPCQMVPKPLPVPQSKKRKRVIEEPPVTMAPKPLLSGAVPLEAFLATLQKVREYFLLQMFQRFIFILFKTQFIFISLFLCINSTGSQRLRWRRRQTDTFCTCRLRTP